jgi:cytochrome c oxidase subunit 2
VGKFWAFLFLTVPVLGVLVFFIAMMGASPTSEQLIDWPWPRHWLPEDISRDGHMIDSLFMFILYLTGVVFIVTEVVMAWFMLRYDKDANPDPVKYAHGSHHLEVIWTILPAAVLLFIALHQMNAWGQAKLPYGEPKDNPITISVAARQFEWRLVYPGKDNKLRTPDDIYTVNELHIPVDRDVVIELTSKDVLHSFFLPNLRVKQDAVPGMMQKVWFRAMKTGEYDLVCAEICGWGHYKMKGRLIVETQEEYDAWLVKMTAAANVTQTQQKPVVAEE